jgi:hypothetical protein
VGRVQAATAGQGEDLLGDRAVQPRRVAVLEVSTVGRDEWVVREYIRTQEAEDRRLDQLKLM